MFAIGFLSLLSVGFVAMAASGGDDDVAEVDQNEDGLDDIIQSSGIELIQSSESDEQAYDTATRNDLIRGYVPIEEVDEETDARIAEFLDGLDPRQPIIDAAGDFRAFVTGIGVEVIELTDEDPEPVVTDPDEGTTDVADAPEYDTEARNDLIRDYVPFDPVDSETEAQITEFLDQLDPNQPIIEAASDFRAFVTELGVEVTGGGADGETEDGLNRPPTGEGFRDPLIIAEELEAQRILDQIAAEIARQPVNLVTVSDEGGTEIDDETVLTEREPSTDPDDQAFDVTAPEGPNTISVNYDAEHTFNISYSTGTTSVIAALNSNILAPDGLVSSVTTQSTDDAGNPVEETVFSKVYAERTEITLNVSADQIAEHVAQIELHNPDSVLNFEFGDDVRGNFHLVFHEVEEGEEGDTSTVKRAFIVQTSSTQTSLSDAEVAQIAEEGLARTQTTNVLAEIFLGTDSLYTDIGSGDSAGVEVLITNFINDNPQITSNITWASVSEHVDVDTPAATGGGAGDPTGGSTGGGDGFVGVGNPFQGISLNPFSYF